MARAIEGIDRGCHLSHTVSRDDDTRRRHGFSHRRPQANMARSQIHAQLEPIASPRHFQRFQALAFPIANSDGECRMVRFAVTPFASRYSLGSGSRRRDRRWGDHLYRERNAESCRRGRLYNACLADEDREGEDRRAWPRGRCSKTTIGQSSWLLAPSNKRSRSCGDLATALFERHDRRSYRQ